MINIPGCDPIPVELIIIGGYHQVLLAGLNSRRHLLNFYGTCLGFYFCMHNKACGQKEQKEKNFFHTPLRLIVLIKYNPLKNYVYTAGLKLLQAALINSGRHRDCHSSSHELNIQLTTGLQTILKFVCFISSLTTRPGFLLQALFIERI